MRIISGSLRGRRLVTPRGSDVRPTADRVREAMFSLIGPVEGLRVLDLYAGSGALAIEALSRGAAAAVLVERARPAIAAVRANVQALALAERCTLLPFAAERAEAELAGQGPFDLLLVDPPYVEVASGGVKALLERLIAAGIAAPDAILVLEHASRDPAPEIAGAELERTRRYGDTSVSLYRVACREG